MVAISPKLLTDGEHVVVSTRTHPKALLLPVLVTVLALAAAIWVSSMVEGVVWYAVIASIAAAIIIWGGLAPLLRWLSATYTFTNRRFIYRAGVLAKHGRTIPVNRISGVDFETGVIDRLFGCGTLIVTDASSDGRVVLPDIPRVEQTQMAVAELLGDLARGGSAQRNSDDGT